MDTVAELAPVGAARQWSPADPELTHAMAEDPEVTRLRKSLFEKSFHYRMSYQFSWLGRPIIQYPEDLLAMQEIIWQVRPRLIIETGVAHGGSLIFYASLLQLLGEGGQVVGIDIDIRPHNRAAIESHPMAPTITLIEGSSIADDVVGQVNDLTCGTSPVMVILDSNHSHAHVLAELRRYCPLVTPGSYIVVFDTVVEDLPEGTVVDRPWDRGDNPLTAVHEFLTENPGFRSATEVSDKLLLSVARGGYLQRSVSFGSTSP